MQRKLLAAFAVMALATQCATAGTASATLSDIHVTLIDLDPNDGVAPWVTFNIASQAVATYLPGGQFPVGFTPVNGAAPFAPVSATTSSALFNASATLTGDPFGAGATASTYSRNDIYLHAVGIEGALAQVYLGGTTPPDVNFQLSPNTRMVVSGTADLETDARGTPNIISIASAFLRFTGNPLPSEGGMVREAAFNQESSWIGVISADFTNSTAASLGGGFEGLVETGAIAMLPEPASATLFGVAALVFAFARRRKLSGRSD